MAGNLAIPFALGMTSLVVVAALVTSMPPARADLGASRSYVFMGAAGATNVCAGTTEDFDCAVMGIVVCAGSNSQTDVGGVCFKEVAILPFDEVTVTVTDDVLGSGVFFGVCVAPDAELFCRPEVAAQGRADFVFGVGQVTFTASVSGTPYVYVMAGADPDGFLYALPPTRGTAIIAAVPPSEETTMPRPTPQQSPEPGFKWN